MVVDLEEGEGSRENKGREKCVRWSLGLLTASGHVWLVLKPVDEPAEAILL